MPRRNRTPQRRKKAEAARLEQKLLSGRDPRDVRSMAHRLVNAGLASKLILDHSAAGPPKAIR